MQLFAKAKRICHTLRKAMGLSPRIRSRHFRSSEYWENRYKSHGNSGAGSYNRLAEFKAEVINSFTRENGVDSAIEFGCGDGNQLSLLHFPHYIGLDVSDTALDLCKAKFRGDSTKSFKKYSDFLDEKADLALSLDVIYHLIEDDVFAKYMKDLFHAALRYVIIYASNQEQEWCAHVKHRKFTDWVEKNEPGWRLCKYIPNRYPFDKNDQDNTSFSDFYIYTTIGNSALTR